MRTFCGTILAAVVAFQAVAGIGCADVSVADFPRLAGESGDSARIMRAVEAAGKGDAWATAAKAALAVPDEVARSVKDFSTDPDVIYRWRDNIADLIEAAR